MKTKTLDFIKKRIEECQSTLNDMKLQSLENTKTKRYWGISQEKNILERILKMEDTE